jgi:hypothetical protein
MDPAQTKKVGLARPLPIIQASVAITSVVNGNE